MCFPPAPFGDTTSLWMLNALPAGWARPSISVIEKTAIETTKTAVRATDNYVHENPWRAIGIAVGIGVVIGLLLNRR